MQEKKLVAASAQSASRVARDRAAVSGSVDARHVSRHVGNVTSPKSPRSAMRKTGIALIAAPDPVTGIAGVGLLAASFAMKKDPANLSSLASETQKIMRELRSLRL